MNESQAELAVASPATCGRAIRHLLFGSVMNLRIALFLAAAVSFLSGCATAPQLPVPLSPTALTVPNTKIGVAMTAIPKVNTFFPGANCLLCLGAAELTNATLSTYVQTLQLEDLPQLKNKIAAVLTKKGNSALVIDEALNLESLADHKTEVPNMARKDFKSLKGKYKVDKLLVLELNVSVQRAYASYFPAGDPKAQMQGVAYLVNLNDNSFEWYLPVSIIKGSDGKWDEPPSFPGLTNAYFQVLEMGKDSILNPLSN
ncbi:MAG: hypothetical protein V4857_03145 [Pseudomonadota bacterium]